MAVIGEFMEHRNKGQKGRTANSLSTFISSINSRGRERMVLTTFSKSGFESCLQVVNLVPVRGWSQDATGKPSNLTREGLMPSSKEMSPEVE